MSKAERDATSRKSFNEKIYFDSPEKKKKERKKGKQYSMNFTVLLIVRQMKF